ncbi:MAG: hypothetical protein FJ291_28265 [Planctomycetes bacterium]|nr:hypothetical protein [Planctomycetota bacterium]
MKRRVALVCALAGVALLACGAQALAAGKLAVGNGISMAKEPKAAGEEAAKKAKAALGEAAPKLVLVHYSGPLIGKAAEVAEGVAAVFPKDIIYGCGAYSALTQESNDAAAAVLALGGDVTVTAAVAATAGPKDDAECGKKLGEALKDAAAKGPGKVLILFGACHIPRNDRVVKGLCGVLGEKFPIVGAAAFQDDIVFKGDLVRARYEEREDKNLGGVVRKDAVTGKVLPGWAMVGASNVGILLTGDFSCGFGLMKDMTPEGLINSARDTFKAAIGDKKDKLALVLVFDCGGRRGEMQKHKNFEKELDAMKEAAGSAPIFGFYGSGEMGCAGPDAAPKGVGYHIAACAIIAE